MRATGIVMKRCIILGLVFFLTLFVLSKEALAQYATPTPMAPHTCTYNKACGGSEHGCTACTALQMRVDNWQNCIQACNSADPATFCANQAPGCGYSCITLSSCSSGCHPSVCTNENVAPDCASTGYNGDYDDCHIGSYVCGYCPGTGPSGGGTPTLPPAPSYIPTPSIGAASNPGTINVRAMTVTTADTSCTAIRASATGVDGTVNQFTSDSASQPAPQTQSGTTYSTFSSVMPGLYNVNSQAPAGYVFARACVADTMTSTSGESLSATLNPNDILTWDLGYTLGTAWTQTQGGDVYASATLQSYVPVGASPRAFILDGAGGSPGVATYGSNYDFDSSGATQGQAWVSSQNWLVNDSISPVVDYYQLLYSEFGGAPTTVNYPTGGSITKPTTNGTYYVTGNMTTSGAWTIAANQNIVFFVNGNLTIGGNINITSGGFVAFIVNGNITVASTVGVPYTSSAPVVEGVYITSPSGTFSTGSSGSGTERFVGRGTFIAGNFLLQRDVGSAGNPTTSSELFIYNPQLLLTMPDAMKQLSVSWQEVAP